MRVPTTFLGTSGKGLQNCLGYPGKQAAQRVKPFLPMAQLDQNHQLFSHLFVRTPTRIL